MLLDTHTFLWYYSGSSDLSEYAKKSIEDPKNEFWVSIVSLWEIAIKYSISKLELDKTFDEFCQDAVNKGFVFLPVDIAHIMQSAKLPFHNRDPFDRILVAQAITENMNFVTSDAVMDFYFENEMVNTIW
ncbi:MAG: type II toxin-antitoxin system VapC family toxin [Bacteroidia bacterium]